MAHKKVRKAVFPVGGLGTRFLPATKSMPKEMLPIVDKPLVHYAYEEAVEAGIEQFIFVTGRNKTSISNHFDNSYELQSVLSEKNKQVELELTKGWIPKPGQLMFTRQQEPMGLGHAIWCARNMLGDEPFAVLLADDIFQCKNPCLKQLIQAYEKHGGNHISVMDVPKEHTKSYGIFDVASDDGKIVKAKGLVEKPNPDKAPSTVAVAGRYILQPEIIGILDEKVRKQERGTGGEIQLTDAMQHLLAQGRDFYGVRFEGKRFDCGSKEGYIEANIAFALERDDMRDAVKHMLKAYAGS
ncbi:MAG: UTP--glucose-1-phosphate uridylyltransferase GalU [Alphaproteobacteria bacterium]|nr:UTP--glucose-1-phosphate uridylyltransferase GalU [Alphaproteobacteria bacterium]